MVQSVKIQAITKANRLSMCLMQMKFKKKFVGVHSGMSKRAVSRFSKRTKPKAACRETLPLATRLD